MPIADLNAAAQQIAKFLNVLIKGGLRVKFRITAGEGAADPNGLETREIYVELAGPDAPQLLARNAEVLHALEHLAAKILRLEQDEHDKISFDSGGYKAMRVRELRLAAETAVERVRHTKEPFHFQPMSSRERRMLHLAFRDYDDVRTESSGEGPRRFVTAYPKDYEPRARAAGIARTFGRR